MDRRNLIDQRIINLLTSTDLTFKQIIETLRNENMPASFTTIRRVNRNHRYRKPRFEAKLSAAQKRELVKILRYNSKPNLSKLARQFGVCHGSIWYWWDKMSKLRERNDGQIPDNEEASLQLEEDFDPAKFFDRCNTAATGPDPIDHDVSSGDSGYQHNVDVSFNCPDPLDLSETATSNHNPSATDLSKRTPLPSPVQQTHSHNNTVDSKPAQDGSLVGPVLAKDSSGQFVRLPIVMFSKSTRSKTTEYQVKFEPHSSASSLQSLMAASSVTL